MNRNEIEKFRIEFNFLIAIHLPVDVANKVYWPINRALDEMKKKAVS